MILSSANIPGQSWPGNDGNEGIFSIPQSSSITGSSSTDCFMSHPPHSLGKRSYLSTEKQSVYSTDTADSLEDNFKALL